MRRRLTSALVLFLVPVVLIGASPEVARAASTGSSVEAEWTFDDWRPGLSGACSFAAYWSLSAPDLDIVGDGDCDTGFNTPTLLVSLTISGSDSDGDLCEAAMPETDIGKEERTWHVVMPVTSDGTEAQCHMTDLCWQMRTGASFGFDVNESWEGCETFDLGSPDLSSVGTCSWGTPVAMRRAIFSGSPNYTLRYEVDIRQPTGTSTAGTWSYTGWAPGGATAGNGSVVVGSSPGGIVTMTFDLNTGAAGYPLKGFNVYRTVTGVPPGFYDRNAVWNGSTGLRGANDPPTCRFYWGDPYGTTGDATSIPIGPATGGWSEPVPVNNPTPGEPEDDGCGFKFTDPSTWAGAGICALVRLFSKAVDILSDVFDKLGEIFSAIGNLAADIAGAILGGLSDLLRMLFVPTPGHINETVDDAQAAWEDTPPGDLLSTVLSIPGKFTAPSGVGCDGPAVPLRFRVGGGTVDETLHPFSTCRSEFATVATIVRAALQIGVWIGAMLLSFRILAGSLGYNVKLGEDS